MKVVLFCGGKGMRLRDYSETLPKPLAEIGPQPIILHLMKYYAYYGHKDFILCLGHGGHAIKSYFRNFDECMANDFVMTKGGRDVELLRSDIDDWRITFVDTGLNSNIGMRLKAVEKHLAGEEYFLANYSDGLTDLPLDEQVAHLKAQGKVASFLSVRPNLSFHVVHSDEQGRVTALEDIARSHLRINGGFFIFKREIFDYMREGEELVNEPFQRLLQRDQLLAYRYDGFWQAMDTFKDRQALEQRYSVGDAPWEVWKRQEPQAPARVAEHIEPSVQLGPQAARGIR